MKELPFIRTKVPFVRMRDVFQSEPETTNTVPTETVRDETDYEKNLEPETSVFISP